MVNNGKAKFLTKNDILSIFQHNKNAHGAEWGSEIFHNL
jgi:hypothetical protein